MSFTTKGHGPIEGSFYGQKQRLKMITEYRQLNKIPKHYKLIDTITDLSKYTATLTKTVSKQSKNQIFSLQLVKNLKSGMICRVGAHVFIYNSTKKQFDVFHKADNV